jgi:hypothetical protein
MAVAYNSSMVDAASTIILSLDIKSRGIGFMANPIKGIDVRRVDPVVEAFRADVDVTLLERNLRLSVEERFLQLMELQRFANELRLAGRKVARG